MCVRITVLMKLLSFLACLGTSHGRATGKTLGGPGIATRLAAHIVGAGLWGEQVQGPGSSLHVERGAQSLAHLHFGARDVVLPTSRWL